MSFTCHSKCYIPSPNPSPKSAAPVFYSASSPLLPPRAITGLSINAFISGNVVEAIARLLSPASPSHQRRKMKT
ncbi:putative protein S-acyltransferase 16 [Iris pallida]|uniref:Uncharacterized protein n=1 Tax=Iris pallida TaxID=29817 RepID=A0AAX6EN82_IRIPA|nr:putative protein S-acyltransferase 16 [Iris pallida]